MKLFCLHLGNKCDLQEERQVQFEEACNLAKNNGILAALETSAKVIMDKKTQKRSFEVDQNCHLKLSLSFSVSRRVRMWRKPSWWWPESCWPATAPGSNSKKATAHLDFSSGPALGQLAASQVPTRHQRRRHVADCNTERTGKTKRDSWWREAEGRFILDVGEEQWQKIQRWVNHESLHWGFFKNLSQCWESIEKSFLSVISLIRVSHSTSTKQTSQTIHEH